MQWPELQIGRTAGNVGGQSKGPDTEKCMEPLTGRLVDPRLSSTAILPHPVPQPTFDHNIQWSDTPQVSESLMWLPVRITSKHQIHALSEPPDNVVGGAFNADHTGTEYGPDHPEKGQTMGEFYE